MMLRRAQPWLGTLVEIAVAGAPADELNAAIARAFARIAEVQAALSFQDAASELTRINRMAQRGWAALSPDAAAVLAAALEFARASDGLFDPSVGGLLVECGRLPRHPGFADHAITDWRAIELDGGRVRYARPLLIDLSGIAKGYAVDAALAVLREAGLAAATVNAGGDLARFGEGAAPLSVRHPRQPTLTVQLAELRNGAAATSANYFQPDALRHPRSGEVLCAGASVTVLAGDCMTADALTKAVAADPARAPGVLARFGAQAILLDGEHGQFGDAGGWRAFPVARAA